MPSKKQDQPQGDKRQRPSILSALFAKHEKDESYLPELKAQWEAMAGKERLLFVLGGLLGLILLAGAILLVYFIIIAIAGIGS